MESPVRDTRAVTPAEPSNPLSQRGGHAVGSLSGNPTLDEMHISCLDDRPVQDALDRLACRVVRSTLERVRTR
jgi:hypothetical protein